MWERRPPSVARWSNFGCAAEGKPLAHWATSGDPYSRKQPVGWFSETKAFPDCFSHRRTKDKFDT